MIHKPIAQISNASMCAAHKPHLQWNSYRCSVVAKYMQASTQAEFLAMCK